MNRYAALWALNGIAAASAVAVARRVQAHRWPAAVICFGLFVDVVTHYAKPWYQAGVVPPYTGWHRVAFHACQALFLGSGFAVLALAVHVFAKRRPWPVLLGYLGTLAYVVARYPVLRQEALGRAYAVIQWATVAGMLCSVVLFMKARRKPAITEAITLTLIGGETVMLFGPYFGTPFDHWWMAQVIYSTTFGACILIQGDALWKLRSQN